MKQLTINFVESGKRQGSDNNGERSTIDRHPALPRRKNHNSKVSTDDKVIDGDLEEHGGFVGDCDDIVVL